MISNFFIQISADPGLPVYIKKPAGGSIISNIVRIVYDACRVRHQHWRRTVVTSDLDNAK